MVISSLGAELRPGLMLPKRVTSFIGRYSSAEKVLARVALVSTAAAVANRCGQTPSPGDGPFGSACPGSSRRTPSWLPLRAMMVSTIEVPLVIGLPLQAGVGADAAALLEETVARQWPISALSICDAGARVERKQLARSICLPGTSSERANSGNASRPNPRGTVSGVVLRASAGVVGRCHARIGLEL